MALQCRYMGPSLIEDLGFTPSREGLRSQWRVLLPLKLTLQNRYVTDVPILRPQFLTGYSFSKETKGCVVRVIVSIAYTGDIVFGPLYLCFY